MYKYVFITALIFSCAGTLFIKSAEAGTPTPSVDCTTDCGVIYHIKCACQKLGDAGVRIVPCPPSEDTITCTDGNCACPTDISCKPTETPNCIVTPSLNTDCTTTCEPNI